MLTLTSILADSDDVPWVKIISVVIALVFWGLGKMGSAAKNANKAPPRPQPPPVPTPVPTPMPAAFSSAIRPTRRPGAGPAVLPPRRLPKPMKPAKRVARQQQRPTTPAPRAAPAPLARDDSPPPRAQSVQSARAAAPATRGQPPVVDARLISRWLKPATLRSQFIITEILKEPLALRPPDGDGDETAW